MSLKIEQPIPSFYSRSSQLEPVFKQSLITTSSIEQASDAPTVSCLDSLMSYFCSFVELVFGFITCAFCCSSKLDKWLEDPRAFLQKLMSFDPDLDQIEEIPLGQENTLAIHTSDNETILYYLCKFEGDQAVAAQLGFEITSERIQYVASKRNNDFKEKDDEGIFYVINSGPTAEFFLKIPVFLKYLQEVARSKYTPLHEAMNENRVDVVKTFLTYVPAMLDSDDDEAGRIIITHIGSAEMAQVIGEAPNSPLCCKTASIHLHKLLEDGIENKVALIKYLMLNYNVHISPCQIGKFSGLPEFREIFESNLLYLCLLEYENAATAFGMIQGVVAKRTHFTKEEICASLHCVKSGATAVELLKIPAFLNHLQNIGDQECNAMHHAVHTNKIDVVEQMIKHQPNIYVKDDEGRTLIHHIRSVEMAKIFAAVKGVDFDVEDPNEDNLIDLLTKQGVHENRELIIYLISVQKVGLYPETEAILRETPEIARHITKQKYQ